MTHPFGSCYEDERRSVPSTMPATLSPSLETPPVQGRRHTPPTKMQCRAKSLQPRKVKQGCVPREESRINFDQGAHRAEGVRESWTLEKQDFERREGVQDEGKGTGLEGVCRSSGHYNNILQTGWLRNNRNVLLRSGKVRSGYQHGWVSHCVFTQWKGLGSL